MTFSLKEIELKITNTETKKKQIVVPSQGNGVTLYTCGPTVYAFAHIGNFRTFVAEDILRRAIRFFGYDVKQVMNITDVDDKTIRGAIEKKCSLSDYTKPFTDAFFEDLKELNIEKVEFYPRATEFIPHMIQMIKDLLDKGYAYVGQDESVYFSIKKFSEYGKLSHLKLDELLVNASEQNAQDEYTKEHASDFVLWKKYDPERDGVIFWESPFGKGRPGWHLECSSMAKTLLGDTIDIHGGGVDLIFPHHENEIAQSECCTGKHFVKIWFHVEHLLVNMKKMSKSLGNFYTLRDLLALGTSGKVVRYLLLGTHYRTQLNFTLHGLDAAKAAILRLNDFIRRLEEYEGTVSSIDIEIYLNEELKKFALAIGDDLNVPEALASVFEVVRTINGLCDEKKCTTQDTLKVLDFLKVVDSVLGVMNFQHEDIPKEITDLVEAREIARKEKNYARSDEIRKELTQKGYTLEDTPKGPRVKKI